MRRWRTRALEAERLLVNLDEANRQLVAAKVREAQRAERCSRWAVALEARVRELEANGKAAG